MVDFPSSPTLNQTLSAGKRSWLYNGTAWERTITSAHLTITLSSTVAEVIFDIPNTWLSVRVTGAGVKTTAAATIGLQMRRSGQGSFDSAGTSYLGQRIGRTSNLAANAIVTSGGNASSCLICPTVAIAAGGNFDGTIMMGTASVFATYVGLGSANDGTNSGFDAVGYQLTTLGTLDRIRIFPSTGSFNLGSISLQRIA